MNELTLFNNPEFGTVRTLETPEGKILFCGKDIATALGYVDTVKAISRHCKGAVEMSSPSAGGIQKMKFIPESDVYRLTFGSKLPNAEKFTDWVTSEVIPQIMRTGIYSINQQSNQISNLSPMLQYLIQLEQNQTAMQNSINQNTNAIAKMDSKLNSMTEVMSVNRDTWREETNRLVSLIVKASGIEHSKIRAELYKLTEQRAGCNLDQRLKHRRERMEKYGASQTKIKTANKLDVIGDDKSLTEIYFKAVQEMAFKYSIT